jgi:hypothetical protein
LDLIGNEDLVLDVQLILSEVLAYDLLLFCVQAASNLPLDQRKLQLSAMSLDPILLNYPLVPIFYPFCHVLPLMAILVDFSV